MKISLLLGLLNEKNNQIMKINKSNSKENEEKTIVGDGKMLMNM